VPTASFGTLFNEQEARERSTDRHTWPMSSIPGNRPQPPDGAWLVRSISPMTARIRSRESSRHRPVARNSVLGTSWSAGVRLTRALPHKNWWTVGAEFIDNVHQNQRLRYVHPPITCS
jgi:hypothetical protein